MPTGPFFKSYSQGLKFGGNSFCCITIDHRIILDRLHKGEKIIIFHPKVFEAKNP
jgi:hypothetical protein